MVGIAVLAILAVTLHLVGAKLDRAFEGLSGASPGYLWAAGVSFAVSLLASALAWHAAARSCGAHLNHGDAIARYATGSLVNSLAPAKLGDAVRIALFSRSIDGPERLWAAGGICAALAAARSLVLAALIVAGSASGALPLWPALALCGLAATLAGLAFVERNDTTHRFARVFEALATLERSPRAAATLLMWVIVSTLAKIAAAAAIAGAFDVPHPLLAALLIVPALDLSGVLPLTPGNVGIASGAVAVALKARGIGTTEALTAGIALHAVETVVGLGLGAAGALFVVRVKAPWAMRLAAAGASVVVAAAFGATMYFDFM